MRKPITSISKTLLKGHQRWDQAVTSGLSDVVKITHENLLPALERCSVITSRFNGLSKNPRANAVLADFAESHSLDNMLLVLDCMRLIGYSILDYATQELRQFSVFSGWLRDQIELQKEATDDVETDEAVEKAASIDYVQLLAYIEGPLIQSKLKDLLDEPPTNFVKLPHENLLHQMPLGMSAIRQRCIEALKHLKEGSQYDRRYCGLLAHLHLLQGRLDAVAAHVSGRLGDTASFDNVVILEREEVSSARDARMILEVSSKFQPLIKSITLF